jgi:tetratricopeptide (TPR) repeat protein
LDGGGLPAAIEEAVATYRALAKARPDAFLPDLAASLNNQSPCLSDLGRQEDALAAVEEAVTIHRTLAETRPAVFASRYAASLDAKAQILSGLSLEAEAQAARNQATAARTAPSP